MKNKKILGVLVIILLITSIVYAGNINNKIDNSDSFFTADTNQIAKNELLTLTIDLEKVQYKQFNITISSSVDLENIVPEDTQETNVTINKETNELKISANKDELDAKKIQLYYQIPETIAIGSKITFKATLISEDNTSNSEETTNNIEFNNSVESTTTPQKQTQEITVTVVEKSQNTTIENNSIKDENNIQQGNMQVKNSNTSKASQTVSIAKSSGSMQQETVTYKGEADNYLTSLSVDNYELIPKYTKTNQTYFITVENNVTDITIKTNTSDSNATVKIYGNTDLKVGENKVLISVTAENGNVRTYRIYVTREE